MASAATPSCGPSCVDLFSSLYGTAAVPAFVVDVSNPDDLNIGSPIVLDGAGNTNQGEDFTASDEGSVSEFITAEIISPGMDALYGSLQAYEFTYSPYGTSTGECMGVGATPGNGTPVTLQACGVSAKTLWIPEASGAVDSYISGATDSNFSDPPVLTDPSPGLPLFTFASESTNGSPFPNQLWGSDAGVLPGVFAESVNPFADVAAPIATAREAAPSATRVAGALSAATVAPATAYVADLIEGAVTPVDVPSGSAGTSDGVGDFPAGVAITPDGATAYVADGTGDAVRPITLASSTIGSPISVGGWAYAVAITPDGKTRLRHRLQHRCGHADQRRDEHRRDRDPGQSRCGRSRGGRFP